MPSDLVIKTGDMIQITIPPPAIIPAILAPVPLIGTSRDVRVLGAFACLEGDELPPSLRVPLPYTAPPFVTPGVGRLSLQLTPANKTLLSKNGKLVLIKGPTFIAQFQVTAPAMQPTPGGPVPDPLMMKTGTAQFITTTMTVKAG